MPGRVFQWIGTAAARVRFNETTSVEVDGARYWAKQRLPFSWLRVILANLYAGATGLPMRMLSEQQWLEYETRVAQELHTGGTPRRQGRRLLLPAARGQLLTQILAGPALAQKQAAVELVTLELARLHQRGIHHPLAGCVLPFSHADATPGNALVDLERGRATWLDYETVHPPTLPAHVRHADDLRTLLCGMAPILPREELFAITRVVLTAYPETPVLTALRETLAYWARRPSVRLLVMPGTEGTQWRCLLETVSSQSVAPHPIGVPPRRA